MLLVYILPSTLQQNSAWTTAATTTKLAIVTEELAACDRKLLCSTASRWRANDCQSACNSNNLGVAQIRSSLLQAGHSVEKTTLGISWSSRFLRSCNIPVQLYARVHAEKDSLNWSRKERFHTLGIPFVARPALEGRDHSVYRLLLPC